MTVIRAVGAALTYREVVIMEYEYLVVHTDNDEPWIRAVFSSEDKAREYINSRHGDFGSDWRIIPIVRDPPCATSPD